jgi:hypothetical protein
MKKKKNGLGPADNRPSTISFTTLSGKKKLGHVTSYMFRGVNMNIEHPLKVSAP